MFLKIKNLGSINQAEIDLSKALILLCGEQDTWQTYLSYSIYHLYSFDTSFFLELTKHSSLEDTTSLADKLLANHKLEINLLEKLDSYFLPYKTQILDTTTKFLREKLRESFFNTSESFLTTQIELSADDEFIRKQISLSKYETHFGNMQKGYFLTANKPVHQHTLTFEVTPNHEFTPDRIASAITMNTFICMIYSILGVQVQLFTAGQNFVADSAAQVQDLAQQTSDFAYLADKLTNITPHFPSLAFYLKHLAQPKDCLIIQEPERELSIDNQISMGNFIGELVNQNFKVIASTNSIPLVEEMRRMIAYEDNAVLSMENSISLFFSRKVEWTKFSIN